jgi:hypothetical protein
MMMMMMMMMILVVVEVVVLAFRQWREYIPIYIIAKYALIEEEGRLYVLELGIFSSP